MQQAGSGWILTQLMEWAVRYYFLIQTILVGEPASASVEDARRVPIAKREYSISLCY